MTEAGGGPETTVRAFVDAWNTHDLDGLRAVFSDDAQFVNAYGQWWRGAETIVRRHAGVFKRAFREARTTIRDIQTTPLSDGAALVHLSWRLEGQVDVPTGDPVATRRGVFSFVLTWDGNRWLIRNAQNTNTPAV